jgi:hypothetical protein
LLPLPGAPSGKAASVDNPSSTPMIIHPDGTYELFRHFTASSVPRRTRLGAVAASERRQMFEEGACTCRH